MLWYVLQTKTGEEEKLAGLIQRLVPGHLYGECFVVYQEQLWRRQQQNLVHVKRVFPGYVFITSKEPEALFFCLKKVPAMAKLMADGESCFLFVEREETEFLKKIMNEDHIIRLSYLSTDEKGRIHQVSGPLKSCVQQIVRCRYGKRHVLVRLKLLGEEKTVLLGIILKEDICQELRYGKVEAGIRLPERYQIKEADGAFMQQEFLPGDMVTVISGGFQGMTGMVYSVKNHMVKLGIRLFGQDMEIEMTKEILQKYQKTIH